MAVFWSLFGLLICYISSSEAINCLVVRPGYGLQSEACPPSAVGCRIRVMSDRIDWYVWAKLYDRNQLVCVYPEEYKTESGCQRKASGSIRCWCGGSDDCNDAENSKALYEAFIGMHGKNDNQLKHNRVKVVTTTPTTTTTRSTPRRVTPKKITRPTTTTVKTTVQTTEKKTKPTVTSTTTSTGSTTSNLKDFPTVAAHPLPTDDDKDKYDEIFAETRKQLEAQMKEEDERLKTMLEDEEEEMQDGPEEEVTEQSLTAEEEGRLERRERARQEERRRQEEEERLARIDREEAEEAARRTRAGTEEDDEEEDYESFGLTSSSYSHFSFAVIAFILR